MIFLPILSEVLSNVDVWECWIALFENPRSINGPPRRNRSWGIRLTSLPSKAFIGDTRPAAAEKLTDKYSVSLKIFKDNWKQNGREGDIIFA